MVPTTWTSTLHLAGVPRRSPTHPALQTPAHPARAGKAGRSIGARSRTRSTGFPGALPSFPTTTGSSTASPPMSSRSRARARSRSSTAPRGWVGATRAARGATRAAGGGRRLPDAADDANVVLPQLLRVRGLAQAATRRRRHEATQDHVSEPDEVALPFWRPRQPRSEPPARRSGPARPTVTSSASLLRHVSGVSRGGCQSRYRLDHLSRAPAPNDAAVRARPIALRGPARSLGGALRAAMRILATRQRERRGRQD